MFVQMLLMEQLDGWTNRASWTESLAVRFVKNHQNDTLVTRVPFIDYGRRGSTDNSYTVGNLMMSVLYEVLGAKNFSEVMGGFYQKYKNTGATDTQFVAYAKQHARRNLNDLFNDWFLTTNWYTRLARGETLHDIAASYAGR